jgi:hypothetical protein
MSAKVWLGELIGVLQDLARKWNSEWTHEHILRAWPNWNRMQRPQGAERGRKRNRETLGNYHGQIERGRVVVVE